jgi:hypothetical protein
MPCIPNLYTWGMIGKARKGNKKRWGGKEKRKKKKGKKSMAARVEHLWRTAHLMCTPQPGS